MVWVGIVPDHAHIPSGGVGQAGQIQHVLGGADLLVQVVHLGAEAHQEGVAVPAGGERILIGGAVVFGLAVVLLQLGVDDVLLVVCEDLVKAAGADPAVLHHHLQPAGEAVAIVLGIAVQLLGGGLVQLLVQLGREGQQLLHAAGGAGHQIEVSAQALFLQHLLLHVLHTHGQHGAGLLHPGLRVL